MDSVEFVTLQDIPATRGGYQLPFEGYVTITQGYNGPISHRAFRLHYSGFIGGIHDDRFSLDFGVPEDTIVLASKAGIADTVADHYTEHYDGLDSKIGIGMMPNVIYLRHDDGTFTIYSHLATGSALVRRGREVKQGQPIARTGLSGWIGPRPHLHFSALTKSETQARRTFPTTFIDYEGPLDHSELAFFEGQRIPVRNP